MTQGYMSMMKGDSKHFGEKNSGLSFPFSICLSLTQAFEERMDHCLARKPQ